jgi:hypothetical protein
MATINTWKEYCEGLYTDPALGFTLDVSRMGVPSEFFGQWATRMQAAFAAMDRLEAGDVANADERRMVGHYWLRAPRRAPAGRGPAAAPLNDPKRRLNVHLVSRNRANEMNLQAIDPDAFGDLNPSGSLCFGGSSSSWTKYLTWNASFALEMGASFPVGCELVGQLKESSFSSAKFRIGTQDAPSHAMTHSDSSSPNARGWIVASRRKSKRLSDVMQREYRAAMTMLQSDFAGDERDYCCAVGDFKRQPPLEYDLLGAPRANRFGMLNNSRFPLVASVQAASHMASG